MGAKLNAKQVLGLRSLLNTNLDNPDLECALGNLANMMINLQADLDQTQRQIDRMAEYILSWQEVEA